MWPSQYPHEREILFGPLTGIEVLRTRTDSSVVVIECAFSINLNALTLEQVVSKRRKVVMDMDANVLADFTRSLDKDEAWAALGEVCNMKSVSDYLKSVLEPLHSQGAEYYNDDAKLGGAINDVVFRANAVRGWAGGLQVCDAARVPSQGAETSPPLPPPKHLLLTSAWSSYRHSRRSAIKKSPTQMTMQMVILWLSCSRWRSST